MSEEKTFAMVMKEEKEKENKKAIEVIDKEIKNVEEMRKRLEKYVWMKMINLAIDDLLSYLEYTKGRYKR